MRQNQQRDDPASGGAPGADRNAPDAWLASLCRQAPEVVAGAVALLGPDGFAPAATWPAGSRIGVRMAETMRTALRSGEFIERVPDLAQLAEDPNRNTQLAIPLIPPGSEKALGVVGIAAMDGDADCLLQLRRLLERSIGHLALPLGEPPAGAPSQANVVLELLTAPLEHQRQQGAATALVTALASHFQCERVSLGLMKGDHNEIRALSHSARFDVRTDLCRHLGAAMDEAIDSGACLADEGQSIDTEMPAHAHRRLREQYGSACVYSFPMSLDNDYIGVITLECRAPLEAEHRETVSHVVSLFAPIVTLMGENERSLLWRARQRLAQAAAYLLGPGHLAWKLAACTGLLTALLLFFVDGMHEVTANGRVEAQTQRAIVAPVEGFIGESLVKAGDHVSAGDVLARLDDRDLVLERRKWSSEREQRRREYRSALASHDRSSAAVLAAQIDKADAQMQLINAQLERSRLLAPVDGVIVAGDLSQSLGSPVSRGDLLFEIAPLNAWRVMLEVSEKDIAAIQASQQGRVALSALPDHEFSFSVLRVLPMAQASDGRNVFLVEATLNESPALLRPGMEGVGHVEIGERRLGWLLLHDVAMRLRLWLWRWWP